MAVTFAALSLLLAVAGVLTNPIALVVAVVFAGVAGLLYYQASGRLAKRVYRRVERQAAVDGGTDARWNRTSRGSAGFGAGPREEWSDPRRREGRGSGRRTAGRGRAGSAGGRRSPASSSAEVTAAQAYDVLDLDPGADQDAIRTAYRERIKDVHPDAEGGDEDAFRRVRTAYERLSD